MISYWISGDDYNQILINPLSGRGMPKSEQYYVLNGVIVKRSTVKFVIDYDDCVTLTGIETDDTDTVILRKDIFKAVAGYAMKGCKFRRLVVPLNMRVMFREKALYGSDTLVEYKSLSRVVSYEGNVFPPTLERKYF